MWWNEPSNRVLMKCQTIFYYFCDIFEAALTIMNCNGNFALNCRHFHSILHLLVRHHPFEGKFKLIFVLLLHHSFKDQFCFITHSTATAIHFISKSQWKHLCVINQYIITRKPSELFSHSSSFQKSSIRIVKLLIKKCKWNVTTKTIRNGSMLSWSIRAYSPFREENERKKVARW